MNYKILAFIGTAVCGLFTTVNPAFAQGTAFTYQGRLNDGANSATGIYDLRFAIYDAAGAGAQQGNTLTNSAAAVSNGLFTVTLDFGAGVFTGLARWLEIGVRTNGSVSAYTTLGPRQPLTPTPYAIFSATSSNVVNGSVVKSLNTLKDDVTLAAGSNVTITPAGNTLTIASAGAGGSGIWSVNGNKAYYNAGNVGVGTNNPANKLTLFTPGSSYGFEHTDGNIRLATFLGGSASGGWLCTLSNHRLNFFVNDGSASMTLHTNGYFGLGTTSPRVRLDVNGAAIFTTGGSGGEISLAAPNGETGMSIAGTARADVRFDGLTLKLVAGPAGGPPSSANGVAITTGGLVGIGTTTPGAKLDVWGDARVLGRLNVNNSGFGNVTMVLQAGSGDNVPISVKDSAGNEVFVLITGSPPALNMYGNAYKNSGGTSWGTFSDRRLKQDVRAYEPGLNEVLQLRAVRFRYRDGLKPGLTSAQEEVGFIAQEVREVIPDAVTEGADGYLMLKADPIHWAAINAIQELNQKMERQRAENAELKARLAKLEQLLTSKNGGAK